MQISVTATDKPSQEKNPLHEVAEMVEGATPMEAFMMGWDYGGAANWQAGAATLKEACARKAEAKGQTELAAEIRGLPVQLPSVVKGNGKR